MGRVSTIAIGKTTLLKRNRNGQTLLSSFRTREGRQREVYWKVCKAWNVASDRDKDPRLGPSSRVFTRRTHLNIS